jgi:hypothetical protein
VDPEAIATHLHAAYDHLTPAAAWTKAAPPTRARAERPTQKVMGGGALRSQMSVRVCERRDVDLILDKGMLTAGWHAHDAPGKFYVLADGHNHLGQRRCQPDSFAGFSTIQRAAARSSSQLTAITATARPVWRITSPACPLTHWAVRCLSPSPVVTGRLPSL